MKNNFRWGIIGTGTVARKFAKGLKLAKGAELVAIGSRIINNAKKFADEFGVNRAYGNYADLAADNEIDVIYVATPNNYHLEHCLLCLKANKAVLCEKPFTTDAEEAKTVIDFARKQNLFCMEAMWMRFIPIIQEAKHLIDACEIGDVCMLRADLGYPVQFQDDIRLFKPELGGGVLLDLGVYPISLAFYLFGAPNDVISLNISGQSGVDEQVSIILKYPQHLAMLSTSFRTEALNDAVIMGTKGRIHVHQPLLNPQVLSLSRFSPHLMSNVSKDNRLRSFAKLIPGVKKIHNLAKQAIGRWPKKIEIPFRDSGIQFEAEEVMQCLRRGDNESKIMPLDETLQIMTLLDIIRDKWKQPES